MGLVSAAATLGLSKVVAWHWLAAAVHLLPWSAGLSALMLALGLFLRWRARR